MLNDAPLILDLRWTMSKRSGDKIHLNADQFKVISEKLDDMLQLGYEHLKPLWSLQSLYSKAK